MGLGCVAHFPMHKFLLRTRGGVARGGWWHHGRKGRAEVPGPGQHRIEVRDRRGRVSGAILELKVRQITILPPPSQAAPHSALTLTVRHAIERGKPRGRDPIAWKFVTYLPTHPRAEAIGRLEWYALRWDIETFHEILKSAARPNDRSCVRPNASSISWPCSVF